MKKLILPILFFFTTLSFAQVGINTTNPEAQLDIKSSNQALPSNRDGLLIPKIDTFPATNPTVAQQGMLVYLTTVVGTNQPGFYFWDFATLAWRPIAGETAASTLDQAYDFGGAGLGRTITADAGAVTIAGNDGFVSTGTLGSGALAPSGFGAKMFWNPRKGAFRAGLAFVTSWNDSNIGNWSAAFGVGTVASGSRSVAFGGVTNAIGDYSSSFGLGSTANGELSTAFGYFTEANGEVSTAFGRRSIASGFCSTAFGRENIAFSYGETAIGIGATEYVPSTTGATQFGALNAFDRLFVIGNAIDVNNNNNIDLGERRNAMIVLKNGLTRLPSTTNAMIAAADGKAVVTKEYLEGNSWNLTGNSGTNPTNNFIGTTDNQSLAFRSNNLERITILNTGNVGIGTTTPARKLQISDNSTSTINGQLYLEQEGTGDALIHIGNTGARHFNIGLDTSADSFKIGTSATIATAVTTGTLMTLLPTGEVGIGTTIPQEKLHVSGPAGLTAVRIANTSGTGVTSNVALDFFRSTAVNTDWRIYNIGANLTIGNSGDDLATVNDLYQFQGGRFMPMNDATQNLGQLANRWNTLFASNGTINTSDIRQKKNIQNLNYGLTDLMKLRPVSFEWKKDDGSGTKLGLIAQELQEVIPEVVRDWDWQEDEQGNRKKVEAPIMGVFYSDLIPVLIKSVQEQQLLIEHQKEENNTLKQLLESQAKTIDAILNRLQKLENK